MSRSASLLVNLLLTMLEVNGLKVKEDFDVVTLTQAAPSTLSAVPVLPLRALCLPLLTLYTHHQSSSQVCACTCTAHASEQPLPLVLGSPQKGLSSCRQSCHFCGCSHEIHALLGQDKAVGEARKRLARAPLFLSPGGRK